jgi:2-polyprenyl-6-hydroxyphenyl methylase/3-demethylubiquinone-9 3-methyltransferase
MNTVTEQSQLAIHFDRRASAYAEKYCESGPRHLFELEKQQRLSWTLKWIQRHSQGRVSGKILDVGCGNGQLICDVLEDKPGWHALGIDLSAGMIEQAHGAARNDRAQWRVGTADQVTEQFDVVTSLGVIGYQVDQLAFVRSVADRVAPGGMLILSFGNRRSLLRKVRLAVQRARRMLHRTKQDVRFRSVSIADLNSQLCHRGFRQLDCRWLGFGLGVAQGGRLEARLSRMLEHAWSQHAFSQWFAQVGLAAFVRDVALEPGGLHGNRRGFWLP